MRRLLSNEAGQSIVEITLITPLILVALYVPIDFGITIFTGHLTQIAVRDSARIASKTDAMTNTMASNLATAVYGNLPQLLVSGTPSTKRVTVNYYADGPLGCAKIVEVTAQGTYNFSLYRLARLFGLTVPDGVAITRTTRMRYESQPDTNGGATGTTYCGGTATATGTYPSS